MSLGDIARMPSMAEDGNTIAYLSIQAAPEAQSALLGAFSIARRTASGWTSTDANPPVSGRAADANASLLAVRFSTDFNRGLYRLTVPLDPADVDHYSFDLYRAELPYGPATWISRGEVAGSETAPAEMRLIAASPSLDRVIFQANFAPLLQDAPADAVYAYDSSGLHLVSVLPDETPAGYGTMPNGAVDQTVRFLGELPGGQRAAHGGTHAVSDDANRVYFSDGFGAYSPLYLRDGDDTFLVSSSHRGGDDGTVPHPATFLAASHDGSGAYFESADQLTDDAPVGGGIYRFDLASDTLELLTPDSGDPSGLSLRFNTAIVSDDGSHIYFVTTAALTPEASVGASNLYVWSEAGTKFLASVNPGDAVARVSRNGRYAVLRSTASLAGAQAQGHQLLYMYDADTDALACASCRADGAPSEGDANLDAQQPALLLDTMTMPRNITDDGRLFFASKDRLLPQDIGAGADIYEYDHGKLSLITTGMSDTNAYMGDNTDDGHDVFFVTRQRLLSADGDVDQLDLYDARVGGGFPEPAGPPAACRDDDCQGAAGGPARLPTPASAATAGSGNVVSPLAKKAVKRSLRLARLTAAQRAALVRRGQVTLSMKVAGGGTVSVVARGSAGRRRLTLGDARRVVKTKAAVRARVVLRLSRAARRAIADGKVRRITIEARLKGAGRPGRSSTTFTLPRR